MAIACTLFAVPCTCSVHRKQTPSAQSRHPTLAFAYKERKMPLELHLLENANSQIASGSLRLLMDGFSNVFHQSQSRGPTTNSHTPTCWHRQMNFRQNYYPLCSTVGVLRHNSELCHWLIYFALDFSSRLLDKRHSSRIHQAMK